VFLPHFHNLAIYGTSATFVNDVQHGKLYRSRNPEEGPELIDAEYPGTHKGDLITSFIDSILNGTPPEVSAEDVFNSMSVCFAIEKAVQQVGPVAVDYKY